jgi:hypothetical protein
MNHCYNAFSGLPAHGKPFVTFHGSVLNPSGIMPSASSMPFMVEAVPIVLHEPKPQLKAFLFLPFRIIDTYPCAAHPSISKIGAAAEPLPFVLRLLSSDLH